MVDRNMCIEPEKINWFLGFNKDNTIEWQLLPRCLSEEIEYHYNKTPKFTMEYKGLNIEVTLTGLFRLKSGNKEARPIKRFVEDHKSNTLSYPDHPRGVMPSMDGPEYEVTFTEDAEETQWQTVIFDNHFRLDEVV
jgi:hypothetical protein